MADQTVRCAIYTRKSSEEGLQQSFNSLDAQREACEAFIDSQKHEGWTALPTHYDDGGVSGGTMGRPSLQKLLADIAIGKVDVVVVYKVDRLTRSLADFAKIVEAFDAKGVSFVSVTQQFNTTTSMGRLTLNVLLSFAQFEREVAGERIRDKIAASKKKGMWMGGAEPLGYDVKDKALAVNAIEAKTIRHIFTLYAELGSVRALKDELDRDGYVSKVRVNKHGRITGGKPFSRGALYLLLQNHLYLGLVPHKGETHEGKHEAIIDEELWQKVQERVAENRVKRELRLDAKSPSLLAGLVFDETGDRLTPTHSNKRGTRYRYYVSGTLVRGSSPEPAWRLPAGDLEKLIERRVAEFLVDEEAVYEIVRENETDGSEQRRLIAGAAELAVSLPGLGSKERRKILRSLISRVVIGGEGVDLYLHRDAVASVIDQYYIIGKIKPADGETRVIKLRIPAKLRRVGKGKAFVINGRVANDRKPDPALRRLIGQAHFYLELMLAGDGRAMGEIADEVGVGRSYFSRVVRLGFLSPEIVKAILTGDQPFDLTAKQLSLGVDLPTDWHAQKISLTFN